VSKVKQEELPSTIDALTRAINDPYQRKVLRRHYAKPQGVCVQKGGDELRDDPERRKEAIFNSW